MEFRGRCSLRLCWRDVIKNFINLFWEVTKLNYIYKAITIIFLLYILFNVIAFGLVAVNSNRMRKINLFSASASFLYSE